MVADTARLAVPGRRTTTGIAGRATDGSTQLRHRHGAAAARPRRRPGFAQHAYPTHPITFINPFPPGGAADVVGRPFAAVLEPIIKQPCVIETKAGAAGAVGAQFAATAKPDGYTLLISHRVDLRLRRGRQAVRSHAEIHPRRLHSDRALHRRSDGAAGQRPAAVQDAEGAGRRRQEASRTSWSSARPASTARCICRRRCS